MRLDKADPLATFLLRSPLGVLVRGVAGVRTSVHRKLLAAFLLVTLLVLLMGAVSVLTIRSMRQQSDLLDRAHQRVEWSQQIHHSLAMQMHLTAMALLVRDEATVASILRENNRFNDTLARVEEVAQDAERQTIQKIRIARRSAGVRQGDRELVGRSVRFKFGAGSRRGERLIEQDYVSAADGGCNRDPRRKRDGKPASILGNVLDKHVLAFRKGATSTSYRAIGVPHLQVSEMAEEGNLETHHSRGSVKFSLHFIWLLFD